MLIHSCSAREDVDENLSYEERRRIEAQMNARDRDALRRAGVRLPAALRDIDEEDEDMPAARRQRQHGSDMMSDQDDDATYVNLDEYVLISVC